MPRIRRKTISSDIEKKIVTGMIISDNFCRDIFPMLKQEYFQVDYAKTVIGWISDYYRQYEKAPGKDIQNVFNIEKDNIEGAEATLIEGLLSDLSEAYSTSEQFNVGYILDQAVDYFEMRSLDILSRKVSGYLAKGRTELARQSVVDYRKVAKVTSHWTNPLEEKEIRGVFDSDDRNVLFRMPGILGDLAGNFERDWLVAFMGPMKRGKCISGDMEVFLADGSLEKIRDIVAKGDKKSVVTFNEKTQRFETNTISELYSNGIKDCWKVKTRTGKEITTTYNHQYLTPNGWKYLRCIKKGGYIAVSKKLDFFGDYDIDEQLTRFLAYMMAEGGCTGTSSTFTNIDPWIIKDFERCCDFLGIGYRRKELSHHLTRANPLLRRFGLFGRSSKTKEMPDEIMDSSKENIVLFLKVFFTCDGSIFKEGDLLCIELTLANEKLIRQISHLLVRFGIVHKVEYSPVNTEDKIFPAWRISISSQEYVNLFLEEIGFDSYKKTDTFKVVNKRSFLDKFPFKIAARFYNELKKEYNCRPHFGKYPKGPGFYSFIGQSSASAISYAINKKRSLMRQSFDSVKESRAYDKYMNSDILWDQIVSIDYVGKVDTYDISVPVHHNFVANDCIVHNSYWLQELAFHALTARLKVVFISLEMSKERVLKRLYSRLTGLPKTTGRFEYPVFDCWKNQKGICQKIEARSKAVLIKDDNKPPAFRPGTGHIVCTHCRGTKDYFPAVWFDVQSHRKALNAKLTIKQVKGFKKLFGDNLRIISYPEFSANFDDIIRDLDNLEYTEEFIPDVVIVDYFDILAPEDLRLSERGNIDATWKRGKNLAGTRHCLVATVSQSTRRTFEKKNISQVDTAEEIRKLAHVEIMFALNQTPEEKRRGVMRLVVLVKRHDEFDLLGQVMVLQQLNLGQPFLDSEWIREYKE